MCAATDLLQYEVKSQFWGQLCEEIYLFPPQL